MHLIAEDACKLSTRVCHACHRAHACDTRIRVLDIKYEIPEIRAYKHIEQKLSFSRLPAEEVWRVVGVRADDGVWITVSELVALSQAERGSMDADLGARGNEVHGHAGLRAEELVILDDANDVFNARTMVLDDVIHLLLTSAYPASPVLAVRHQRVCRRAVRAVGQHVLIGAEHRAAVAPYASITRRPQVWNAAVDDVAVEVQNQLSLDRAAAVLRLVVEARDAGVRRLRDAHGEGVQGAYTGILEVRHMVVLIVTQCPVNLVDDSAEDDEALRNLAVEPKSADEASVRRVQRRACLGQVGHSSSGFRHSIDSF